MKYAEINIPVPGNAVLYLVLMAALSVFALGMAMDRKHNNNPTAGKAVWWSAVLLVPVSLMGSVAVYDEMNVTTLWIYTGVSFFLGVVLTVAAFKTKTWGLLLCAIFLLFVGCCGGFVPIAQPWPR